MNKKSFFTAGDLVNVIIWSAIGIVAILQILIWLEDEKAAHAETIEYPCNCAQCPCPDMPVQPAPPLLCWCEPQGWTAAACNPVNDATCNPSTACADACATHAIVEVPEIDYRHEDGYTWRQGYCAAFDTASILWRLYFGEKFPVIKSSRCPRDLRASESDDSEAN